jgi:hypothetical protein
MRPVWSDSRTLPERLYKRVQLQVEANDDTDGCHRLTTQDAPITVDKIETILAAEEDSNAIDKAINAIKKTVRLSIRNRVATSRAMESRE